MLVACWVAYWVLRADLRRRKLPDVADAIIAWTAFSGMVGAKLYHVLEHPADLASNPFGELFSRSGFAWAGSLIAGVLTLILLARHYKWSLAAMFDVCSPAAAIGYGVGRIGCLISGDGDYGIPSSLPWAMSFPNGLVPTTERVHPTPIYEFLASMVIFYYLWRLGARSIRERRPCGEVIGAYFLWTGAARFLVEFIRINPRSVFGMLSNAQLVALISMLVGTTILARIKRILHLASVTGHRHSSL